MIRQKDTGYLKSCNLAAQEAKGNYVVFLHHAVQVQLNWLYPLVQCMERRKAGLAGGKVDRPGRKAVGSRRHCLELGAGAALWKRKESGFAGLYLSAEVDFISGGILMAPKGLWEETGGFEESYSSIAYACADLAFWSEREENLSCISRSVSGYTEKDSPDNKRGRDGKQGKRAGRISETMGEGTDGTVSGGKAYRRPVRESRNGKRCYLSVKESPPMTRI